MPNLKPKEGYSDLEGLEGNFADPMFDHVKADEAASDGAEVVLGVAMEEVGRILYDEGGANDVAEMLKNDERPLYQSLPEIAVPFLTKAYQVVQETAEDDEVSDVMFGEGGVLTQVVDALFDVADMAGHPEAQDEDQYAAALIGVFNKVGEHISNEGDEAAMSEIADLGMSMAATNPDGSMNDLDAMKDPKQAALSSGIAQSLYGPSGGMQEGGEGGLLG